MTCDTSTIVTAGCFNKARKNVPWTYSILNMVFEGALIIMRIYLLNEFTSVGERVQIGIAAIRLVAALLLYVAVNKRNMTICKIWLIFEAVLLLGLSVTILCCILYFFIYGIQLVDQAFFIIAIILFTFKILGLRLIYQFTKIPTIGTNPEDVPNENMQMQNTAAPETGHVEEV